MNIIEELQKRKYTISTAESLTAGLVSSKICEIAGASKWFLGGVVSYTKEAKCSLLGLERSAIDTYGVYSKETAISMAKAIQEKTKSTVSIATTGVAGPGFDEGVPAGTVYFGFIIGDKAITEMKAFDGNRNMVRQKASEYAILRMCELLNESF